MNREIKFRAKEWDGDEWIVGGGVEYFGDHAAMLGKEDNGNLIVYKVASETVGEFTGLKDKNGKEIYEGDIVQWDNERYKIIYDQAMAQFNHQPIDPDGHDDYFELGNNERQKVIGNIHENPELIEEAKQ